MLTPGALIALNVAGRLSPQLGHLEELKLLDDLQLSAPAYYTATGMFDNVTLSGVVTDVGTLGALLAVPVAIVAAFWGVGKVTGMFKRFIR